MNPFVASSAASSTRALKLVLLPFVAVAVALLLPGSARPAAAQSGQALEIRHSGGCLGVEAGSTASGAPVQQQACDSTAAQRWISSDVGGGFVQLRAAHSGLCLNVEGGTSTNLARLIQWPCVDAGNEQFQLVATDGGWSTVRARHSGKCIDIEAGSVTSGARAIQYDCHGGLHQQFRLADRVVDRAQGRWGPVIGTPLVPAAASGLPDGRVLLWAGYGRFTFGGNNDYTQTAIFDPATSASSSRQVSNTGHQMFCPGIANLADGRILVNGGSSSAETSIYNPATDSWETGADMNVPRGYQGTTLLSDGSAFTLGGSWSGGLGNKSAEVWTESGGWQRRAGIPADPFAGPDPRGIYRADNHLWLFGWKDETVFHAGPSRAMHWIDTAGSGSYRSAGNRGNDGYAMNGNAVMYEPGKILAVGGAPAYDDGIATANATVIDITGPTVTARPVPSMGHRRGFHSSTVLPNGQVVVTGGQAVTVPFSDDRSVLATEIWDPDTERFTTAAPMSVPRNYHSMGLLLADGRVLVGGGGLCGNCATNHADVQIFTPPYLLDESGNDAVRPRIISAPDSVDLSETFRVTTNAPVAEFSLVRVASATHAVNNDQRRIPLSFTSGAGNLAYDLRAPSDGGVAIPGAYLLFAMNAEGVPSVASVVTVTTDRAPLVIEATIKGTIGFEDGSPAPGAKVDLFRRAADGSRGRFIGSTTADSQGRYSFDVQPGADATCYVLTFIAPDGERYDGSRWYQPTTCLDPGQATSIVDATLDGVPGAGDTAIAGTVRFSDGDPAAGVKIDLFRATADGARGRFLGFVRTDGGGRYRFEVGAGCYVLTMIAPDGSSFDGSRWYQTGACAQAGEETSGIDAVLDGDGGQAGISGTITSSAGGPVAGAKVDLFRTSGDGSRGTFLGTTRTGADGGYGFDTDSGCHTLTFVAPDGFTYGGSRWWQPTRCLDPGQRLTGLDAVLDPVG